MTQILEVDQDLNDFWKPEDSDVLIKLSIYDFPVAVKIMSHTVIRVDYREAARVANVIEMPDYLIFLNTNDNVCGISLNKNITFNMFDPPPISNKVDKQLEVIMKTVEGTSILNRA